jgi:YaiO family outer membrane protein
MPNACRATLSLIVVGSCAAWSSNGRAQEGWSVEVGTEPSFVDINGRNQTWWTTRVQGEYRDPAVGGAFVAGEIQRREGVADEVLSAGGYRRLGDWTIAGVVAGGIDADFAPRYSLEPQLSRRLFGTFVGQVSYVYRSFRDTQVELGSVGGIQYFRRGEVEARVAYGNVEPLDRVIRVYTIRGHWDDGSPLSFGGSVNVGQNLYGVINVPGAAGGDGWILNTYARYRFDRHNSARLGLTFGREEPSFRQSAVSVAYRRTF